jgi:hypothetical protein
MRPLKPIDRISLFVAAILEPAKAGGMTDAEATSAYNGLMRSYANMQESNPAFVDLLFENAEKAINTRHISNDRS